MSARRDTLKLIIAGGRDFDDAALMARMLSHIRPDITEVVCGDARGADKLGEQWAIRQGLKVKHFPADWKTHGNAAGPIRNRQMAEYADVLVAFWDGQSRGTANMIETMKRLQKPHYTVRYD